LRVKFDFNKCGETSIIAQQVRDDDGIWTFRKWNPTKTNVPYGQSTDAEADSTLGPLIVCYICAAVNCLMSIGPFEEVINHFVDGIELPEKFFEQQKEFLEFSNKVIRTVGILLTILGFFCLFSPIIALLKFIPLVGVLLASVASFAAFIFSLIVGLTLSSLTIGVAWVFFRPLIGIPLLCLTAGGIYLAFFYQPTAYSDIAPSPTPV
jgi:hypothetical protein